MSDEAHDEAPADGRGIADNLLATLIVPILAVGLTIYYLISTAGLVWEARSTGWMVGGALMLLSSAQIFRAIKQASAGEIGRGFGNLLENSQNNRRRLGLLAVVSLFTLLLPFTGTTLGLALALCAGMLVMGVRNVKQLASISIGTAAAVFLLLIWLTDSRLPQGIIEHTLLAVLPN